MAQGKTEIKIARKPDEVWGVVGDFGALDKWLPGVETCRLEGDDRHLAMMGMEITETLIRKDDDARAITYGITAGVPVEHHEATITVNPDGDGSSVTWDVDVDDAMTEMMVGIYTQGLEALKAHLES
ncbi:MAG: SRPBCC family protein [Acidimicrobiia bacterium]|nr:SRPBCC family protein [Acidimicrobiia bacterium]